MGKAWIAGMLAAFAMATPAVAKDWKLTLAPAADQQITYREGRQIVRSDLPPNSGAQLEIGAERFDLKQSPSLYLTVKNHRDAAVNFTSSNVTVSTDLGPVAVLTLGDIQAQARAVEKKARQAAMWQAIAVGLQAGAAGMPQTQTYTAHTYSPYGGATTFGSYTTPGNQAASAAIMANGQNQIAATQAQGRAAAEEILSSATELGFRPATLEPGAAASTALTLAKLPSKAKDLIIKVNLNDETHVFAFTLTQVK